MKKVQLFYGQQLLIAEENGSLKIDHIDKDKTLLSEKPVVTTEENLVETLEEVIAGLSLKNIEAFFDGELDEAELVEGDQIRIETFEYELWIDTVYDEKTNKYYWHVCSVNLEEKNKQVEIDYSELEKNKGIKKTWKGLLNYIKRFIK